MVHFLFLDICIYILYPSVDSTEDPEAEPDPSVSEDAVLPVWADLGGPWQTFGWWHPTSGHRWHGEVRLSNTGGLRLKMFWLHGMSWIYDISAIHHPYCPSYVPFLSHMCRLKDVQTLEELGDVYNHFLLYYGRDIPKMQNAAKASKKRLKKIKEVSEDGKLRVSDWFIRWWWIIESRQLFQLFATWLIGCLFRWRRGTGGRTRRRTERTRSQAGVS